MCTRIPITSPLLLHNGHQILTKPPHPFPKSSSSASSSSFNYPHLCLPLSASAMAALFHPRSLRRAALLSGALNLAIITLGTALFPVSLRCCGAREKSAVSGVVAAAALRIGSMLRTGIAQGHAAVSIASAATGGRRIEDAGDDSRHRRRVCVNFFVLDSVLLFVGFTGFPTEKWAFPAFITEKFAQNFVLQYLSIKV